MIELLPVLQETRGAEESLKGLLQVIAITVIGLGSVAAITGLLSLVLAVAPNVTSRASSALRSRTLLSYLVGLVAAAVLTAAALILGHVPGINVVVLALVTVLEVLALEASSETIGRKLSVVAGRDSSRVKQVVWGWLTLAFASGVPFLGWFVIFPCAVIGGLGGVLVGFFAREEI